MVANVFVIGLDERNRRVLETLPQAGDCRFHQLLDIGELQHDDRVPFGSMLSRAESALAGFPGSVDAVVGYWDFPVTLMASILTRRFGLAGPCLDSRLACEHKYWSRVVQQEVTDAHPEFAAVEPFARDVRAQIPFDFPFWIKPVKSFSSVLSYRVDDMEGLELALDELRAKVRRIGEPFGEVLALAEGLPDDVAALSPNACIAETPIGGAQCTVEGFACNGDVVVYGVVDSHTLGDVPSFDRFQYPTSIPERVRTRMCEIVGRVVRATGLDATPFNVELFWEPSSGRIDVLEVNPRHSESHAKLFELVTGCPNHSYMLDLALGREPCLPRRSGRYDVAAKFFVRHRGDGVVRRVPSREEIAAAEEAVPGAEVCLDVAVGDRLSRLYGQDAYSYKLAHVFVGADEDDELEDKYRRCLRHLPFEVVDLRVASDPPQPRNRVAEAGQGPLSNAI